MRFVSTIVAKWPTERALIAASWVGLSALAIMAASLLYPAPILLVAGMLVAQLLGTVAFVLYLLSVAAVYRQETTAPTSGDEASEKPEQT
jgi:uncharacterized membrane protein